MYKFDFNEVEEEDIIRGALESDIAVFLHGKSSEGKSARVKQFDPDCEIIYLRNASPDSLNGKSVYVPPLTKRVETPVKKIVIDEDTKEEKTIIEYVYEDIIVKDGYMLDVKPSWLVKLEEKCEKDKDTIHVVFFDELTNALHTIQGMAFNIILDREVNGKWKLPENARVVAAGNDLTDSMAANTLAEPLFNRFAHTYIETNLDKWLKWARKPINSYERIPYKKPVERNLPIHPAIYAFLEVNKHNGNDYLRTQYDGIKPNADPRKWEMASRMLYTTGNPLMLRSLIGEGLAKQFSQFCSVKVVSLEDVIAGRYSRDDYNCNLDKKYMTIIYLAQVDEENVGVVRDFVKKMGMEYLTMFDKFWVDGDPERQKIIDNFRNVVLSWRKK